MSVGVGTANLGLAAFAESKFAGCCCAAAVQAAAVAPAEPVPCVECVSKKAKRPKPAVSTCAECDGHGFCEFHGVAHAECEDHVLSPITEDGVGVASPAPANSNCTKHKSIPLGYYCMKDKVPVCAQCVIEGHPLDAHSVLDLATAAAELSVTLQDAAEKCAKGSISMAQAAAIVNDAIAHLNLCFEASSADFTASIERVKAALDTHRDKVLKEAASLHRDRVKALGTQFNWLTIASTQLGAVAGLSVSAVSTKDALTIARAVDSVRAMSGMLAHPFTGPCVAPVVEVVSSVEQLVDDLEKQTRLRTNTIAAGKCVVSGSGLEKCLFGREDDALKNNYVAVTCVDYSDAAVADLSVGDVQLTVRGVGGEEKAASPLAAAGGAGGDHRAYAVTAGSVVKRRLSKDGTAIEFAYDVSPDYEGDDVLIDVVLTGSGAHVRGSPFRVKCPLKVVEGPPNTCRALGTHVKTIPFINASKYGVAVSPDVKWAAVTDYNGNSVVVYDMSSGAVVRTIGGPASGSGPCQFNYPFRLCFAPNGNLLVCDWKNNRVQELTVSGRFVRSIAVASARSVACDGRVIVVGNYRNSGNAVEVYSYKKGTLLKGFGVLGSGPKQIGSRAEGVRITPDGKHVLVAEYGNHRLSLFTMEGVFVRHIGAGVLCDGNKDVEFAGNGEIIVADYSNYLVCVFSADGATLLRSWGRQGGEDGEFVLPVALAVRGSLLYVLDYNSPRLQVFQ